jgi:hypothetical protein
MTWGENTGVPMAGGTAVVKFGQIKKKLRSGRTAVYYYALVPVRIDPSLEVGDVVELLVYVTPYTFWLPGKVFGKFKNNYQIYLRRGVEQVVEYAIRNKLPVAVYAVKKVESKTPPPRRYYIPATEEEKTEEGGGS